MNRSIQPYTLTEEIVLLLLNSYGKTFPCTFTTVGVVMGFYYIILFTINLKLIYEQKHSAIYTHRRNSIITVILVVI